jgi:hypothetical protein
LARKNTLGGRRQDCLGIEICLSFLATVRPALPGQQAHAGRTPLSSLKCLAVRDCPGSRRRREDQVAHRAGR